MKSQRFALAVSPIIHRIKSPQSIQRPFSSFLERFRVGVGRYGPSLRKEECAAKGVSLAEQPLAEFPILLPAPANVGFCEIVSGKGGGQLGMPILSEQVELLYGNFACEFISRALSSLARSRNLRWAAASS